MKPTLSNRFCSPDMIASDVVVFPTCCLVAATNIGRGLESVERSRRRRWRRHDARAAAERMFWILITAGAETGRFPLSPSLYAQRSSGVGSATVTVSRYSRGHSVPLCQDPQTPDRPMVNVDWAQTGVDGLAMVASSSPLSTPGIIGGPV
mmetsp:Transcript_11054/g.25136  ORF Transcript_11054/g.25136 Transcript_11054/m.25136 type:complete len:150 (-) Transcript_11054:24-473(-)